MNDNIFGGLSLPVWGEGIEIVIIIGGSNVDGGLSPYGERGLK